MRSTLPFVFKDIKPQKDQHGITFLQLMIKSTMPKDQLLKLFDEDENVFKAFAEQSAHLKTIYLAQNKEILDKMAEDYSNDSGINFDEAAIQLLSNDFWIENEDVQLHDYIYI